MEPALLGVVLDSSVLIAAERARLKTPDVIKRIRAVTGDVAVVVSALTVAELGHGIYRADTVERRSQRRELLNEVKAQVPIHPVTAGTAEIIAKRGGEQAEKGITLALAI